MNSRRILPLFILLFLPAVSNAQLSLSGLAQSSVYGWETLDQQQRWDYYQTFQFKVGSKSLPDLGFTTYFRIARRNNPAKWQEKFYNFSVNWHTRNKRFEAVVGRQFLYYGVMNGTVDAALFTLRPNKYVVLRFVGGLSAKPDRSFSLGSTRDGNVVGAYASVRLPFRARFNASYFQRNANGTSVWQLLGTALNGRLGKNVYYNTLFDYNLNTSEVQRLRTRLTYYLNKWTFTAEWNQQRPRIYEDSYFKIFATKAYNQVRASIAYSFRAYQIGLQLIQTQLEEDNNQELILNFGNNRWGMLGLLYQRGFGGDNLGLYGDIRYPLFANLFLRLYASYYNYQRHTIEIDETAAAYSAGLQYNIHRSLQCIVDLQQSSNSFYKKDVRGLFRLNYFF